MKTSSVTNSAAADGLFDLAAAAEAAPECKAPDCHKPVVRHGGRGQPKQYCSVACRSRSNRGRTKQRTAAAIAAAAPAAPEPAPAQQAGLPDPWLLALPEEQRLLMRTAQLVDVRARLFLEHVASEPTGSLAVYLAAIDDLAERLRGQARAVAAAAEADLKSGRSGNRALPAKAAAAPIPDRSGKPAPSAPTGTGAGSRLRGLVEQRLAQQEQQPAPAPKEPELAVPQHPGSRGLPATTETAYALDPALFGDYWRLEGWRGHPNLFLVTGEGYPVGWVERDVPGIEKGWVAVYQDHFLGDATTGSALLYDTPEAAAYIVHQAYLQQL